MMFDDVSDAELIQLYELSPGTPLVHEMIERAMEEDALEDLQDHAYAVYWQRQLAKCAILEKEQIDILLGLPKYSTARSVLGDAARQNKLKPTNIAYILQRLGKDEWAYKQVRARKMVLEIKLNVLQQAEEIRESEPSIENSIESLLELKTTWAILELVPKLPEILLLSLSKRMNTPDYLTRHDRHRVRMAIDRKCKNRKRTGRNI